MIQKLENIIIQNIKKIPEVPLSFLLSGGIDCSLVLALLRKVYPNVLISTFCLAKSKDHQDIIFARKVSDLFETKHNEIILSDDELSKFLKKYNEIKKYNHKGNINWYILCNYAKKFSNIIVTGDGGDECFGGYWLHKYPLGHKENGIIKSFEEIDIRPKEHLKEMFDMGFRDFLFKEKSQKEDYEAVWKYYLKTIYSKQIDPLMYTGKILNVKIYSPLFSKELIDFMRNIPYTKKINKEIERELALKYLPESIIKRKKIALNIALKY